MFRDGHGITTNLGLWVHIPHEITNATWGDCFNVKIRKKNDLVVELSFMCSFACIQSYWSAFLNFRTFSLNGTAV
jgi:hypothetical protein